MRIRRLKLAGFKSFVEPAELVIEPGLTGVVGPNGCGKSNLLEAIRWVMGESSARSLRGGGMEDVIFAGTATRPAREFAEVTILINAATPGDGPLREMEVVRRIERGAGSAYRIDGRDARAKDVGLLFADAATGAHSPALVSQGRIAAVIAAKPAERRTMLEEAAGIAGLHVRRKDAEQKLRATEANLLRLDELLGEMDARAATLRRQARAAEKYRALSAAIRLVEARLLHARWRDAAALAEAADAEAARADALVATAAEAQRAGAVAAHDAAADLTRCRAAAGAARDAAAEAGRILDGLRGERRGLERRIAELSAQADTLAADRAREDTLGLDAAAALVRLVVEDRTLATRIAAAEATRGAAEACVHEAEGAARDAEVALAHARATLAAEQAEWRVAQAALATARGRLDRAGAEQRRVDAEAAALGDPAPLEAKRAAATAARIGSAAAGAAAQAALAEAEQAREGHAAARDAAQSVQAAARATLASLEGEARALARALEGGADRALAQVAAAEGYEHALAAALGDDIDAMVGAAGKRRWTGGGDGGGDPTLPPGIARLADHVTAPPAMARRLAQVGVVDTDDGSIVLAPGQRLVTRGGRVRRWDGFVAEDVGAAAAERLVRANRLALLEGQLPPARAAVQIASDAFAAAGAALADAQTAMAAARATLARSDATVRRAGQEEDAAVMALDRLATRREAVADRMERAAADHAESAAQEAAAREATSTLPDGAETRVRVERLAREDTTRRAALGEARAQAAAIAQAIEADRRRQDAARAEAKGWRARAGDAARRVAGMAARADAVAADLARLADRPAALDARIAGSVARDATLAAAAAVARAAEQEAERTAHAAEQALAAAVEALATAREARAGALARQENHQARRTEASRVSGERFRCPAVLLPEKLGFAADTVASAAEEGGRFDKLSADRERLGPVNLVAEDELAELDAGRARSAADRAELGEAIARLRGSIGSLNREGRTRLRAAFEAVDTHFRRLFTTLFAGGEAHLALVDSDDPLEAGLEIMAQPPGKKLATLTLLSGGEQALTAVALIFALFLTNPAPICVLDEVDAPLDDANIERFCDLLDRMVADTATRYLIVTHNTVTMSRMHRLFGVTMTERGVSRLVSVDLGAAEGLLAAE